MEQVVTDFPDFIRFYSVLCNMFDAIIVPI